MISQQAECIEIVNQSDDIITIVAWQLVTSVVKRLEKFHDVLIGWKHFFWASCGMSSPNLIFRADTKLRPYQLSPL